MSTTNVAAPPQIPGLQITTTGDILGPETRYCVMIHGPSGFGKTNLGGSLDAMTRKFRGKPTLYIPVEAGEGGGAATIQALKVPMYVPKDWSDLYKVLGLLENDKQYGGIVFDSASHCGKTHIKRAALAYPDRDKVMTRQAGVPSRSDYQTMGELMSQLLLKLIGMSCNRDPAYRKDIVVMSTDMTKEDQDTGRMVFQGPDLPGRMRYESVQQFQQVLRLLIKPLVVDGKRVMKRYLSSEGSDVIAVKDRLNVLPPEIEIRKSMEDPTGEDLCTIWEKFYVPRLGK